jgi:hypothetical protein
MRRAEAAARTWTARPVYVVAGAVAVGVLAINGLGPEADTPGDDAKRLSPDRHAGLHMPEEAKPAQSHGMVPAHTHGIPSHVPAAGEPLHEAHAVFVPETEFKGQQAEAPSMPLPVRERPDEGMQASPEVRKVRFMTSAGYKMSSGAPSAREMEFRASLVSYEAGRRLRMLTDMYQLSPQQQALVFPVLARASQAYHPALEIEGEAATDAYLAAWAQSAPTGSDPDETTGAASGDAEPDPDAALAMVKAKGPPPEDEPATESPDPLDDEAVNAAIESSLDVVEAQLAPFLDEEQLALMNEEQVDRLYWWGEILLQISAELDDETLPDAEDAGTAPGTGTPGGSDQTGDSTPPAHQGGNLFDP